MILNNELTTLAIATVFSLQITLFTAAIAIMKKKRLKGRWLPFIVVTLNFLCLTLLFVG